MKNLEPKIRSHNSPSHASMESSIVLHKRVSEMLFGDESSLGEEDKERATMYSRSRTRL